MAVSAMYSPTSVSYTHLDVYKRQTYERAKKKKLKIINLGVKEDGERKSDIQ